MEFAKRHKKLCIAGAIIAAVIGAIALCLLIWGGAVFNTVASPCFEKASENQMRKPKEPDGAQMTEVEYLSEVLMMNGLSDADALNTIAAGWDDSWFDRPGTEFNFDLANFCIAACAMANGESLSHSDRLDFDLCEKTLSPLGFEDIDTSAYEGSSFVSDELHNVMESGTDDIAFTLARKTLAQPDGRKPQELIMVAMRGTYGSEWLSNFKLQLDKTPTDDHFGYLTTSSYVLSALLTYCDARQIDYSNAKLLITGHSRGASVAGMLAATAIDLTDDDGSSFFTSADQIYTYCFATSPNTKNASAGESRYAGIFNLLNPTDLVPTMPLAEWGYTCWGSIGTLPGPNTQGFADLYRAMNEVRAYNTGYTCTKPYRKGDKNMTATLRDELAAIAPHPDDVQNAETAMRLMDKLTEYDLMRILSSHFPDTYIAWLSTLEEKDIVWQEPKAKAES